MLDNPTPKTVEERLNDLDERLTAIEEMLADFYDEANLMEEEEGECGEDCKDHHKE